MLIIKRFKIVCLVLAIVATTAITACSRSDNKELLSNPKVGDIYAAEITHFSSFMSESGKEVEDGYGLLKVTSVSDKEIKVITTSWYLPSKRGIPSELRKYQPQDQWDRDDVILVQRDDIPKLLEEGQIFDVRRKNSDN